MGNIKLNWIQRLGVLLIVNPYLIIKEKIDRWNYDRSGERIRKINRKLK